MRWSSSSGWVFGAVGLGACLVSSRAAAGPPAPDETPAVVAEDEPKGPPPVVAGLDVSAGPAYLFEIVAGRRPPVHFSLGAFVGGMGKPRLATPAHWAVGYAPELSILGGGEYESQWLIAMRHMFALQGVVGRRGRIFWSLAGGVGIDFDTVGFEAFGPTMASRLGVASRSHPGQRHRLVGGIVLSGIMQVAGDTGYPRSQIGAFIGWTWL